MEPEQESRQSYFITITLDAPADGAPPVLDNIHLRIVELIKNDDHVQHLLEQSGIRLAVSMSNL